MYYSSASVLVINYLYNSSSIFGKKTCDILKLGLVLLGLVSKLTKLPSSPCQQKPMDVISCTLTLQLHPNYALLTYTNQGCI